MSTISKMLLGAALAGSMLLAGAAPAQARDWDNGCGQRIRNAEWKLQRDINRHGPFSRQARKRREELARARQSCGWGANRFRGRDRDRDWGRDRDRDWDRDHDRDRR